MDDKKLSSEELDIEIKRIQMERERILLQKEINRSNLINSLTSKIRPILKITAGAIVLAILGYFFQEAYRFYKNIQRDKEYALEEQASKYAFEKCNAEINGMWKCADNGVHRDLLRKSGNANVPACYTEAEHNLCIEREYENFLKRKD